MPPSRRGVLRLGGTAMVGVLAGCSDRTRPIRNPDETATSSPTSPPAGSSSPTPEIDHPTTTPRDPRPLETSGAWPQFGSEASRDGVSSNAGVRDPAEPYWQLRRVRSGPAVLADGRLFHYAKLGANAENAPTVTRTRGTTEHVAHPVYGEPHLVARDASEGRILWSAGLEDGGDGWPAVVDGQVIIVAGQLAAFDTEDGQRRWSRDLGGLAAGDPTVAEDAVVIPVRGGIDRSSGERHSPGLRAYGLADGSVRWQAELTGRVHDAAFAEDTVVAAAGRDHRPGEFLAVSLGDGSERWRIETPGISFRAPVVADGRIYLSSEAAGEGGAVRAFALADGSELWHHAVDVSLPGVAADADTAYVAAGDALLALATDDGSVRWTVDSAGADEFFVAPPAASDAVVYAPTLGDRAHLYAIDGADGRERWTHRFPNTVVEGDVMASGVERQPALADGAVYVHAADGLYAFGPSS